MKIAMMVRGYIPAPRPVDMVYAPIDLAVAIAKGLGARGHTVDFFAPLGSEIHAPKLTVETLNLRPLVHNQKETTELFHNADLLTHYVPNLWDRYMANEMFARANHGQYDLLYFHHPEVALPSAQAYPRIPIVYTLNDPIYPWYKELFELYDSPNQHYVSISENQRRDAPDLPYAATVYNGIDVDEFTYCDNAEDYLLFAGRIVPEKGIKEAIQVANETGNRLLIIGPTYPDSQDYFDQYIKPNLSDKILYLGYVEREHMSKYYQKAKALLTPVQWEEPFGLTTIEAMACGTPVISLRRGAASELIVDGKTGFVVQSIAEMVQAVQKLDTIDRNDCREHVKQHFSVETMVDGYEKVFDQLIRQRSKPLFSLPFKQTKLGKVVPGRLKRNLRSPSQLYLPVEPDVTLRPPEETT